MFETPEAREKRLRAEAAFREANVKRYEARMGVELPYSPVAVLERKPDAVMKPGGIIPAKSLAECDAIAARFNVKHKQSVTQSNVNSNVKPAFNRKAYMREYMKKARAKEKKCPHCGGKL